MLSIDSDVFNVNSIINTIIFNIFLYLSSSISGLFFSYAASELSKRSKMFKQFELKDFNHVDNALQLLNTQALVWWVMHVVDSIIIHGRLPHTMSWSMMRNVLTWAEEDADAYIASPSNGLRLLRHASHKELVSNRLAEQNIQTPICRASLLSDFLDSIHYLRLYPNVQSWWGCLWYSISMNKTRKIDQKFPMRGVHSLVSFTTVCCTNSVKALQKSCDADDIVIRTF